MSTAFDIAASGMAAHRAEMDVIAENIANAGLAGRARQFHPHAAVFAPSSDATFADALGSALGAQPSGFSLESGAFATADAFAGDDPFAPAFGDAYSPQPVRFAGVVDEQATSSRARGDDGADSIGEMVALVAAGRAYDADVASLQAAKQMDVEAIDVDRS